MRFGNERPQFGQAGDLNLTVSITEKSKVLKRREHSKDIHRHYFLEVMNLIIVHIGISSSMTPDQSSTNFFGHTPLL